MTHLYIEQNTGLTEEVNSSIISKLYELAISGDLDNTSDLKGRLHSTRGYDTEVTYLNEHFSDLHISVDKALLLFKDMTLCNALVNSLSQTSYSWSQQIAADQGFTRETASQVVIDSSNKFWNCGYDWSQCTSFMELAYFPLITSVSTRDWNSLQEIDCTYIKTFSTCGFSLNKAGANLRTFIYSPQNVTSFEGDILNNAINLNVDIYFPNNSGNCSNAFRNSGIERILNPGPGTTMFDTGPYGYGGFRDCPKLKYISLPKECVGIKNVVQNTGNSDAGYMLGRCPSLECVIFNCPSVFQIASTNHFNETTNNTFKIYVPDNLVNSYKSDTYWSNWSSKIFGISQLETDNAEYYQLWYDYSGVEHT